MEVVSRELNDRRPGPERDRRKALLAELIVHIVDKHHEYLRTEMPTIEDKSTRY